MIDVRDALPPRNKPVIVMIEDKEYDAWMLHNDWIFLDDSNEKLGIKTMLDNYRNAQKITHWKYK
jgi:hypothetical protein